jgi:hypothetical protein
VGGLALATTRRLLGFCLAVILILASTHVNVGTLHRTRYGFLMALVALGVAGGVAAWTTYLAGRRRRRGVP